MEASVPWVVALCPEVLHRAWSPARLQLVGEFARTEAAVHTASKVSASEVVAAEARALPCLEFALSKFARTEAAVHATAEVPTVVPTEARALPGLQLLALELAGTETAVHAAEVTASKVVSAKSGALPRLELAGAEPTVHTPKVSSAKVVSAEPRALSGLQLALDGAGAEAVVHHARSAPHNAELMGDVAGS